MLVSALVNLEDIESISYDISFYRRQGRLNEIVNRVRRGNVEGVLPMVISYKGEVLHVHPGILLSNNDFVQPLLSDHQQTVCVAYPNGKRAWIAEGKSVERAYGEEQRINLHNRIVKDSDSNTSLSIFITHWTLDINGDGREDYVSTTSFFYSVGDRYFHAQLKGRERGVGDNELFIPSSNKSCTNNNAARTITTDGKSYYLDACNLTELTTEQLGTD